jgi:hypothetical protein
MRGAGVDIPHGRHYSRVHKAWLEKTGFSEIHRAMRIGALLCAENSKDVQAWWASLPPERREARNPQHIWRCFSETKQKKPRFTRRRGLTRRLRCEHGRMRCLRREMQRKGTTFQLSL